MAKNDNSRIVAALSYILIGIIWYFADKSVQKDAFAKFHVKQGIILLITSLAVSIVGTMVPFIGWFIIAPIGSLLCLIWTIIGIVNSLSGQKKELFLIGQFAEHLKF